LIGYFGENLWFISIFSVRHKNMFIENMFIGVIINIEVIIYTFAEIS